MRLTLRLLVLLHLLSLLDVSLLELLRLLLMPLFHLLPSRCISLLPIQFLMFSVLLLLQSLPFAFLLPDQFILLVLVSPVHSRVAGVRHHRPFPRRQVSRMDRRIHTRRIIFRAHPMILRPFRRRMHGSRLSGAHNSAVPEIARPRRCRNGRRAVVYRCPQLSI